MPLTNYEGCWSEDEQAFYWEGGAWGVNKELRTVWLGKEEDVIKEHPATLRTRQAMRRLESEI